MENTTTTRNILIVEDNPGDFVLINEYLNEEFYQPRVEHAKTFIAAKGLLKSGNTFDIILLDLSLPDGSGEFLVSQMAILAGLIPVIVLTGYSDKAFGIKTLSMGMADYLLKDDLSAAQLYKSICYSIERRRITMDLKESEENYRNLFDISPVPMWVYNWETGRFININKAAIEHFGYSKKEFLTMTLFDISPYEEIEKIKNRITTIAETKGFNKGIFKHLKKNGELIEVEIHSDVYSLEQKLRLVLCNDITESVYQKNILALEKEVYKLNSTANVSFQEVMDMLTQKIELLLPGSFCAILQKQDDNTSISLSKGSMPAAYIHAIEGGAIGPNAGSCGTAIYTGQNVIVTNIEVDPLWENYKDIIRPFGFKACWSIPIKKSDGKVLGSFATFFKLTKLASIQNINLLERAASLLGILIENRNAVDDIKKWNERYDVVSTATNDVIWDWDLLTNKIFWNKGIKEILGYTVINESTSTDWWGDKVHKDDVKRVIEKIHSHINNTIMKWQDEYRFLCNDGHYKYISDRGFLLLDKHNKPVRMIGAMRDISRQKEEDHRLKLLESVITNASDSVIITHVNCIDDSDHTIIYTNDAFTKMTGYSKEEVIGKTPKLFQGPNTNKAELKRIKKAIKRWDACEIEVINYKKNGEEFWNNIAISPVADSTGSFTHWIAIQRDITVRKKKDQEITKAIISAQEHERFQIGGELHDNVNQILAGVLLNLGMTKTRPVDEQPEWINKSVEYIHLAISEIRKLSHKLAPVSLDENSLKETFEKLLSTININNRFSIDFFIDEVSQMHVDGDIQLNLYRILQEQTNNIMKYSKATVIEISLLLVKNAICLRIYDNGIGFDTKKIKDGIGLHNIKKRTELFSGHFTLKSAIGKGCEIIVEIPV
ncbi:MAG: PAS domain S-box protein [Ferruginibacter sp.]|nr:PAS domain S-box protein [Ferruginibacter sp.]